MAKTESYPCPRCASVMEMGFASGIVNLSFMPPEKFAHFAFKDEDLAQVGWLRHLLPSKAEYFRSYLCRECEFYLVDWRRPPEPQGSGLRG